MNSEGNSLKGSRINQDSNSSGDAEVSKEQDTDRSNLDAKHIPPKTSTMISKKDNATFTSKRAPEIKMEYNGSESDKNEEGRKPVERSSRSVSSDNEAKQVAQSVIVPVDAKKTKRQVIYTKKVEENTEGCLYMFVKYPCFIAGIIFFVAVICTVWIFVSSKITIGSTNIRDFLTQSDNTYMYYDSINIARDYVRSNSDIMEPENSWTTHLVVVLKAGNSVFTQENIKVIRRIAAQIHSMNGTKDFCLKNVSKEISDEEVANQPCHKTQFMRSIIYDLADDVEDNEISSAITRQQQNAENRAYIRMDASYAMTISNITRIIFYYGTKSGQITEEQNRLFKKYSTEVENFARSIVDPELSFYVYSEALYEYRYMTSVGDDCEFLFYSGAFLACYLWFRSKSLFLTICGLIQVAISLPISYMLYSSLFRSKYLSAVHIIVIYIGVVVTAECIIIFTSNWRHSKRFRKYKKNLRDRLSYTMRKSLGAITSSTIVSIVASCCAGFSNIVSISSFGYSMAIVTFVNYVLLYTFFPCVLLFYWKYIRKLFDCVDCVRRLVNPSSEKYREARIVAQYNHGVIQLDEETESLTESIIKNTKESVPKLGVAELVFEKCYGKALSVLFIPILGVLMGLMITTIYFSTKMKSMTTPEQLLPNTYDVSYARRIVMDQFGFGEGTNNVIVRFVYGIEGVNRENVEYYDPKNLGEVKFVEDFELTVNAILELKKLCDYIENNNDNEFKKYRLSNSAFSCFIGDFIEYLEDNGINIKNGTGLVNGSIPNVNERLFNFTIFNKRGQYYKRSNQINVYKDNEYDSTKSGCVGDKCYKLKYIQILVEANTPQYAKASVITEAKAFWDTVLNKYKNKTTLPQFESGFQTAMFQWCFIDTGPALLRNALIGICVTLAAVLIVVLIGIKNIFLALYATFFSACVLTCDMALLGMFHWEYNTMEAVMTTVVLGLMSRYIFLILYSYFDNPDEFNEDSNIQYIARKSKGRARFAVKMMGPVILNSSIATFGSVIFIYLCALLLLEKFGIIISFTVLYSFAFSIAFLPALLMIIGPKKNCGNLRTICAKKEKKQDNNDNLDDEEAPSKKQESRDEAVVSDDEKADTGNRNEEKKQPMEVISSQDNEDAEVSDDSGP